MTKVLKLCEEFRCAEVKFPFLSFQEYIKSLCNPELQISVPFSEQFYNVLFKLRDDLEKTTSAVVKFPSRNKCSLQGSAEAVTMAQSSIEDKLKLGSSPPQPPSIEPQLREFAMKLGYSNQVIDQAVQKLGSNVTQNTLLNELLKTTASLPYQISASTPQPKPAPAIAQYQPRRDVVARGAPNTPPPHMLRTGYENPSDKAIRPPVHAVPHNWDPRDIIPRGASAVLPRPSYEMPGDVPVPRGTKRVLERPADISVRGSSSSVQPLMHLQPYSQTSMYDVHREAGSSGISASDRLDEQEQQMYQQIIGAKKVAGNNSSNLRPVVIDGSNVAMR